MEAADEQVEDAPEGAVIIIGSSSSRCSACGRDAFPEEISHDAVSGYARTKGCGVRFTHVSGSGPHLMESAAKMRPDLPLVQPDDLHRYRRQDR